MTRTVRFVAIDDSQVTHEAYSKLRKLPDLEIQVSICPRSVGEWFQCPFIQDEDGLGYFGLEGIEYFVSSSSSSNAGDA